MRDLLDRIIADSPAHMLEVANDCSNTTRDNEDYIIESITSYNTKINIFSVNGATHPNYTDKNWLWIMQNAARMQENLNKLSHNSDYYYRQDSHDKQMHFTNIGKFNYIEGEGHHRTTISKALFHYSGHEELYGVNVTKSTIDDSLKSYVEKIRSSTKFSQFGFHPIHSLCLIHDKNPIEKRQNMQIERKRVFVNLFVAHDTRLILDAVEVKNFYEELESFSWSSRLPPLNKYAKAICKRYSIGQMFKDRFINKNQ